MPPTSVTLLGQFKKARNISTPLLRIISTDPAATIDTLCQAFSDRSPAFQWDLSRGLLGLNEAGRKAMVAFSAQDTGFGPKPTGIAQRPSELLQLCLSLPGTDPVNRSSITGSVIFMLNAHLFLEPNAPDREIVLQGIANLRDEFKATGRMLVMLGIGSTLPPELSQDVMSLVEPLPDAEQLEEILTTAYENNGSPFPDGDTMDKAVIALRGLAAFPADQSIAMHLGPKDLNISGLWERKRDMVKDVPGVTLLDDDTRFSDIKGVDRLIEFMSLILRGKRKPGVVWFEEEIEKALSGQGDSTGTNKKLLGQRLEFMSKYNVTGLIFVGPAGTGKTQLAQALARESGVLTLAQNATVQDSLVGSSSRNQERIFQLLRAISDDSILAVATSNSLGDIPSALLRRYGLGVWMIDLPSEEAKRHIWQHHMKKFELEEQELPDHEGWSGDNIKMCCELASEHLGCSLVKAAEFIIPASIQGSTDIEAIRTQADGRYFSAHYPGVYRHPKNRPQAPPVRRAVVRGT